MKNIFLFENLVNIFKNTKLIIKFTVIICFLFTQISVTISKVFHSEEYKGHYENIYKVYSENQNYNVISISQSDLFDCGITYIRSSKDDSV